MTVRRPGGLAGPVLLASITVSFLAASSAPTPVYALYAARWHFSPITTTVVLGVYAVVVLTALLVLGRVSGHLGRRPVLLAALALQVIAMVVFSTAGGVGALVTGRVLQGIATGGALGALGAAMLDIDRERGTRANAVAPGLGSGVGALRGVPEAATAVRHLQRAAQGGGRVRSSGPSNAGRVPVAAGS
ncbi:MFS transporter [Streptomyces sp. NPDC088348]|uniref:MFS transporter n=1 Tax=Streptomyces sp. NPDC088348 TaxID=3365853 RepID=UPI00381A4B76